MRDPDHNNSEVIVLTPEVALTIAGVIKQTLPIVVNQAIARSDNYPVFKVLFGYVYLTYGNWCSIATKATHEDFLDWVGAYRLLAKSIKPTIGHIEFDEVADD